MMLISYDDLVKRHGTAMAYDLLLTVERLAKIQDEIHLADEETRFHRALEVLNETDFAGKQ
jgi:hypothetical protein